MRDQLGVKDSVGFHETERAVSLSLEANLKVEFTILKYDRDTNTLVGREDFTNAVSTAGKQLFLDVMRGASTSRLDTANSALHITGTGTPLPKTFTGCDSGFPQSPGDRQQRWQWSDISIDEYTVSTVEVRRGALVFSSASPTFSGGNVKPASQNWIYQYTLTISGGGQFQEPVTFGAGANYPGLHEMLRALTANIASWATLNLNAYTTDGYANLHATVVLGGDTRTAETVKWTGSAGSGSGTGGPWQWILIENQLGPTRLRISNEGWGSKQSTSTWSFEYSFSV